MFSPYRLASKSGLKSLVFALSLSACAHAQSAPDGPVVPDSAEAPNGRPASLETAFSYLSVPENRSDPDSRTIEIAYLHMRGSEHGYPTFVFFGGPGESALDYETLEALRASHDHLLANGDVVFIEQRGIGASPDALDCEPMRVPLDEVLTAQRVISEHRRIVTECVEANGADLAGYSPIEIADDVEAVRQALGFERVNLSGGSFGAQQAYFYLRRHGAHVERAVLSQFLAPGTSLALPAVIDQYVVEVGDLVGPGFGISENGGQQLLGLVSATLDQIEANPVEFTMGGQSMMIGRTDIEIITSLALRRTQETWRLPALYSQMNSGDFSFIAPIIYELYRAELPVNAAVIALDCSIQALPERRLRFDQQVGNSVTGAGAHLPFPGVCDHVPHGDVGPAYSRAGSTGPAEILFIQASLDPRARDENLADVLAAANARLLVVENVTHDLGASVSPATTRRLREIEAGFLSGAGWPDMRSTTVPLPGAE